MRQLCALPCVTVFNDGIVAVVELTIMVAWALIWQHTAVALGYTREDITCIRQNSAMGVMAGSIYHPCLPKSM